MLGSYTKSTLYAMYLGGPRPSKLANFKTKCRMNSIHALSYMEKVLCLMFADWIILPFLIIHIYFLEVFVVTIFVNSSNYDS